jgi:hypothetical protein
LGNAWLHRGAARSGSRGENVNKENLKQRIVHEVREFLVVFLCLAPFFASFRIYRIYLTGESGKLLALGIAMVNALVMAKVILIGEIARLGRRSENKPLFVSTIHKAIAFALLYLAFHVLEDDLRSLLHGQSLYRSLVGALLKKEELLSLGLVIFFAFIPLFALREVRRVMGADNFRRLFFGGKRPEQFFGGNRPEQPAGLSGSRLSPGRV